MASAKKSVPKNAGNGAKEGEILTYSKDSSNVQQWKRFQEDEHTAVYGALAVIIRTSSEYVAAPIKKPTKEDLGYESTDVVPQAELDAAIQAHMSEMRKHRTRKSAENADSLQKLYGSLRTTMSQESLGVVDADPNFDPLVKDPVELMKAVDRTHLQSKSGQSSGAKMMDKTTIENALWALNQGSREGLAEFMTRWNLQVELTKKAGGLASMKDDEIAYNFMLRLDKAKYAKEVSDLCTEVKRDKSKFPETVLGMYEYFSKTVVPNTKGAAGAGESMFLSMDHEYSAEDTETTLVAPETKEPSAKSVAAAADKARKANILKNAKKKMQAKVKKAMAEKDAAAGKQAGTATGDKEEPDCLVEGCGGKHKAVNCPKLAEITAKEMGAGLTPDEIGKMFLSIVGDFDDHDQEDCRFALDRYDKAEEEGLAGCYKGYTATYGSDMFPKGMLLIDNQAGRSIVKDEELLTDIHPVRPWSLGGVNEDAETLIINREGVFGDLGSCGIHKDAAANILSQGSLVDSGADVRYEPVPVDRFVVTSESGRELVFSRLTKPNGQLSGHYGCNLEEAEKTMVGTVASNLQKYSNREIKDAEKARDLQRKLAYAPTSGVIATIRGGITNSKTTVHDAARADAIWGPSAVVMKGTTKQRTAKPVLKTELVQQVVQQEQNMLVDIFFVKGIPFLSGLLLPLDLILGHNLTDRTTKHVANGIRLFLAIAAKRGFSVLGIKCDGEGAVEAMRPELSLRKIPIETTAADEHVAELERAHQTIKSRYRSFEHSFRFAMCKVLIVFCVLFCISRINLQPRGRSVNGVSSFEEYGGRKPHEDIDMRCGFGEYVQATEPDTDNSPKARTEGCITLLPTGSVTGSVRMLKLRTMRPVTRQQFTVLPMPDTVINYLNAIAKEEGYQKGDDPSLENMAPPIEEDAERPKPKQASFQPLERPDAQPMAEIQGIGTAAGVYVPEDGPGVAVPGPADGRELGPRRSGRRKAPELEERPLELIPADNAEVPEEYDQPPEDPVETISLETEPQIPEEEAAPARRSLPTLRRSTRSTRGQPADRLTMLAADRVIKEIQADARMQLRSRARWYDKEFAFTMSVRAAMRDKPQFALPVVLAELRQMLSKKVWHPVHVHGMNDAERKAILRSSMFMKDKYTASGNFEKFKARLVAGGNRQVKELYDDLSSPTAATTSVMICAAIAAYEMRLVMTIDIGGAFLNADMPKTGVLVHMKLDRMVAELLVKLDESYKPFLDKNGELVVELDKALYGCVEAAKLWYDHLSSKLVADGFQPNAYDTCVFNKMDKSGKQITIVMHVDDLLVTCENESSLEDLQKYLRSVYPEITVHRGKKLDYLGMTFDFLEDGEVSVTMDNMVNGILDDSGVSSVRETPAGENLFVVREEATRLSTEESQYFHSYVARLMYLAKRVRPECMTAISFLATRINECDEDDMKKLVRVIAYIRGTRDMGITLRVGASMSVEAYIDAAYGVHTKSGKSHTGCAIVIGDAGTVYVKSGKQKIVTKSSTEAELVGLSDSAAQAIHVRNFVLEQGYEAGPVVIHQDNLSCMALMKRGGPCSDRSRHISIRHFWLKDRVDGKEVVIRHLGTKEMFANALTKPVQGAQFKLERQGLTNWKVKV
jgi:hypothetical protein